MYTKSHFLCTQNPCNTDKCTVMLKRQYIFTLICWFRWVVHNDSYLNTTMVSKMSTRVSKFSVHLDRSYFEQVAYLKLSIFNLIFITNIFHSSLQLCFEYHHYRKLP